MLHNEAVSSKPCIKNRRFFPLYNSKLHEKCNELVKDRIFKLKVKVKAYQLLKNTFSQKLIFKFLPFLNM